MDIEEIKKESQAFIYLHLLNRNLKSQPSEEESHKEIMMMNLKYQHLSHCQKTSCFCQIFQGDELIKRLILEKIEQIL